MAGAGGEGKAGSQAWPRPFPSPRTPGGSTERRLGQCPGSWTRQPAIARGSGRLVVSAPGQPSFRFPRETPVPTGRGSCACRSGSVPLRPWQRGTPPACVITRVPWSVCFICPRPRLPDQCRAGDQQPLAAGMRSGGILPLAPAYCHGQIRSEDAHAGLPKPQDSETRRRHVRLTAQRAVSPEWESGSALFWSRVHLWDSWGANKHRAPSPPHTSSRPWQGPEAWLEPAVGQLAHMAPEAPVAPQSGCQALKFPVDHNSN